MAQLPHFEFWFLELIRDHHRTAASLFTEIGRQGGQNLLLGGFYAVAEILLSRGQIKTLDNPNLPGRKFYAITALGRKALDP